MPTLSYALTRPSGVLPVAVEYAVSRGESGARDGWGAPSAPAIAPSLEITSVTDDSGGEVRLSVAEERELETACWRDCEKRVREETL